MNQYEEAIVTIKAELLETVSKWRASGVPVGVVADIVTDLARELLTEDGETGDSSTCIFCGM